MLESASHSRSPLSLSHAAEDSRSSVPGEGALSVQGHSQGILHRARGQLCLTPSPAFPTGGLPRLASPGQWPQQSEQDCEHLPILPQGPGARLNPRPEEEHRLLPASGPAERAAGRGTQPHRPLQELGVIGGCQHQQGKEEVQQSLNRAPAGPHRPRQAGNWGGSGCHVCAGKRGFSGHLGSPGFLFLGHPVTTRPEETPSL